tara:strand:- start:3 stop:359 length:357 start_codon:yes stop_codon:yes gene_type:complete
MSNTQEETEERFIDFFLGDSEEFPPEEALPNGWHKLMKEIYTAAGEVEDAIDRYEDAHRRLLQMDVPEEVKQLAKRGLKTSSIRKDNWRGIMDDSFVINRAMRDGWKDNWRPYHMEGE